MPLVWELKQSLNHVKLIVILCIFGACRVRTLMKRTCWPSVIDGRLSGTVGAGHVCKTSITSWVERRSGAPLRWVRVCGPPWAARAFWQTSASQRSAPCTVKTPWPPCLTLPRSPHCTCPGSCLIMVHFLPRAGDVDAHAPKISWGGWKRWVGRGGHRWVVQSGALWLSAAQFCKASQRR